MGPDPELQRAVINTMARRDARVESRTLRRHRRESRGAVSPAGVGVYLASGLGRVIGAVARRVLASSGWRR